jgi:thymidylate kinase
LDARRAEPPHLCGLSWDRVDRWWLRDVADECGASAVVVHVDTPIEVCDERRRRNEETKARGRTTRESFEFVRGRFEAPSSDERSIVVRPDDDLEPWLERLRALL